MSSFGLAPSASQSSASAFATSTAVPADTDSLLNSSDIPSGGFSDVSSMLNAALSLLLFGLLFAAIAFGAVCTKALGYARQGSGRGGVTTKLAVAGLVFLNFVQMAITVHAVYTSLVVDFDSNLFDLLNTEWSIAVQLAVMTITASLAQSFFVCRLHAAKHNAAFTGTMVPFILLQLALSIFSAFEIFQQGYATVMITTTTDVWPMATTFGISAALDITLAAVGYVWLQKPHTSRFRGGATAMDQMEYWTLKSLFGCGLLSLYGAIGVSIMGLDMSWLAVTFVLGNLYTLSVLLNVTERRPVAPVRLGESPEPPLSEEGSTYRASIATLAPDSNLLDDIFKAQAVYPPSLAAELKERDLGNYTLGYHPDASAV